MDDLYTMLNNHQQQPAFSFAEELSADELEEQEAERFEELQEIATEIKQQAKTKSNESLPGFIWSPVVNLFDDCQDYIELAMCSRLPEIAAVANIIGKHADYFDYIDALDKWNSYYEWVLDEYGSWESFEEMVKDGIISIPLINAPRLKKTPENKGLRKLKCAVSRVDVSGGPSDAELSKILADVTPSIEIYTDEEEYWTHLRDVNRADEARFKAISRVRGLRRIDSRVVADPRADAIMQFLNRDTFLGIDDLFKPKSFAAEMEELHRYDGMSDEEIDALMSDVPGYGYGVGFGTEESIYLDSQRKMIVDKRKKESTEIYKLLDAAGFDVGQIINGVQMDKKSRRMIKRDLGLEGQSEKEIKRLKKERKRKAKADDVLRDRLLSDHRTRDMLMHNKIAYERNDDLLSFTLDSILRSEE